MARLNGHVVKVSKNGGVGDNDMDVRELAINKVLTKNALGHLHVVYREVESEVVYFILPAESVDRINHDRLVAACQWGLPSPPYTWRKSK